VAKNPFSHIDLRVRDSAEAVVFYRAFLPLLGFTEFWEGQHWKGFDAGGKLPAQAWFGFTEDAGHQPNGNRIAFWAESPAIVDGIARALAAVGAQNIEGPMACDEYSRDYYAVFFEDPSGNKLEVMYRTE
jgi:catechol 2,3-dioxygenase-like lactoylglutathione lyase family enzyme